MPKMHGDNGGDVIGPLTSTDNAIPRFDGPTGGFIQNSTATIDDNGAAIFNTGNNALGDFQIKGQVQDHLLFADVSNNAMAMLTNTTQYQINGSTITPTLTMKREDSGNSINQLLLSDSNTGTRSAFNIFARSRNSGGTPIAVLNNDRLGAFRVEGHDGTQFITGGRFQFEVDGTPSTGIIPTNFGVYTMDTGGTLALRLLVNPNGRMRILSGGLDQVVITPEGGMIVNQQGNSSALADLRVESTSYANMFRVDASADEVNIGTAKQGAIASFSDSLVVVNDRALDMDFRVEGLADQNLIRTDAANDKTLVGAASSIYSSKFSAVNNVSGSGHQGAFINTSTTLNATGGIRMQAGAWGALLVTHRNRGWMELRSTADAIQQRWHGADYLLKDTGIVGWDSTSGLSGAGVNNRDLGIARDSAATLEINDGTAGSYGDLLLRGLTSSGARHVGRTDVNATPYNVAANDQHISHSYSGTGASSVVLPAIAAANDGREITVVDAGYNAAANVITINITGADTIGNAATFPINTNGDSITVRANNTTKDWEII